MGRHVLIGASALLLVLQTSVTWADDRHKARCVKCVPKRASARVAPSNIVYLSYGYRSTGKGVLTTEILLIR